GPNPGWWYGWYGAGQGGGGTGTESTDPNSPYFHDFTAQGPSYSQPSPFTYGQFAPPTMEQVQNEPGYKLGLNQGLGALQNSAAAKGSYFTPNTLEGLSKFATDYA